MKKEEEEYLKYSIYYKKILWISVPTIFILGILIGFGLSLYPTLRIFLGGSLFFVWVLIMLFYPAYCGIKYKVIPSLFFHKPDIIAYEKQAYKIGKILLILGILLLIGYIYFILKIF